MKYLEHINAIMKDKLKNTKNVVVYGQNVSAGSCIGGLSRGIKLEEKTGRVINTTNSENTAVGVGFGLMLNGVSSVFYMKQLDFLLLGIDQLVNTYNYIRTLNNINASFNIVPAVVDSGYEGIQASLNTVADFSSISMLDAYTVNNKHDIDYIMNNIFLKPGFRIIGVSQRLGRTELIEVKDFKVVNANDGSWFKYSNGNDVTVVSVNFSFPQAYDFCEYLKGKNVNSSLYSINCIPTIDWTEILNSVEKTKKLIIIDDSKSLNSYSHQLIANVATKLKNISIKIEKREHDSKWYRPNLDEFELSKDDLYAWYKSLN